MQFYMEKFIKGEIFMKQNYTKMIFAMLFAWMIAVLLPFGAAAEVSADDVAQVGDVGYSTLQSAIDAAQTGDTVTLLKDISLGSYTQGDTTAAITINKEITLDGNGKTLTSQKGRAINIDVDGSAVIKNLTVKQYAGRNKDDQKRCVNVLGNTTEVTLSGCNLELVEHTYSGSKLTSYVAGVYVTSGIAPKITIDGCNLSVIYGVVNYGNGSEFTIQNSTITNALYGANICAACDMTVTNTFVSTKKNMGTNNLGIAFVVQAAGVDLRVDASSSIDVTPPTVIDKDNKPQAFAVYSTFKYADFEEIKIEASITKTADSDPVIYLTQAQAQIYNANGTVMYDTLADAAAAANENETITLLANAVLEGDSTTGKVTLNGASLDLNGKKLTISDGATLTVGEGSKITVDGTLNIEKGGKIVLNEGAKMAVTGEIRQDGKPLDAGTVIADAMAVPHDDNYMIVLNKNGEYECVKKGVQNNVTGKYYPSLQAAIDDTRDGETLILVSDVTLTEEDIITQDGKNVLALIEGKSITLNLNGYTISVDADTDTEIDAVLFVENGAGLRVINESSNTSGKGGITIGDSVNVANMFLKNGAASELLIEAGTYDWDVSDYCAEGYCAKRNGTTWTVSRHSYSARKKSPTCTSGGYTTYTCACGDSYVGNRVAKLGHRYGAAATCTQAQTCTVCQAELKAALGHTPGEAATCTQAQTCTVCQAELKAALGHTPGEEATCTEAQTCTVCQVEVAAALGHKPGEAATCTQAQTCTVCQAELTAALGHTPGEAATCTTAQICTVCQAELKAALGHAYENACDADCNVCEYVRIPAEHDFGEWVTTKEATRKETGSAERVCNVCEETEIMELEKVKKFFLLWILLLILLAAVAYYFAKKYRSQKI